MPFAVTFLLFLTDKKSVVPENEVLQNTWRVNEGTAEPMVCSLWWVYLTSCVSSGGPDDLMTLLILGNGWGGNRAFPVSGLVAYTVSFCGFVCLFVFNCFLEVILGACIKLFHLEVKIKESKYGKLRISFHGLGLQMG